MDDTKTTPKHKWLFEKYPKFSLCFLVVLIIVFCDVLIGHIFIPQDMNNFRSNHYYYHHGMLPNKTGNSQWGNMKIYPVFTNSLGFIDSEVENIELESSNKRIVFIGDSFTEGVGLPFGDTFVGILKSTFEDSNIEILNAAAMSYSPKLYYYKIKYFLEVVGLRFDELFVFIDISDIQDEVLYRKFYPSEANPENRPIVWMKKKLIKISFLTYSINLLYQFEKKKNQREKYDAKYYPPWLDYFWLENQDNVPFQDPTFRFVRSNWTTEMGYKNKWTQLGLKYAIKHMDKLLELCRVNNVKLSIAVYPWIHQIMFAERNSKQVQTWKLFCDTNKIEFINLFPDFINDDLTSDEAISKYFFEDDTHWNLEGHKLVATRTAKYLH